LLEDFVYQIMSTQIARAEVSTSYEYGFSQSNSVDEKFYLKVRGTMHSESPCPSTANTSKIRNYTAQLGGQEESIKYSYITNSQNPT